MSINRVNISGNLTRNAELRGTPNGTQVLTFGVAVNDRRRNAQTGEWEDVPNFVDCIIFGKRAQSLAGYLSKGTKVAIEGKLRYSSWESNGQRRSKLEVVVDEIEFLSRSQGQGGGQYQNQGGSYQNSYAQQNQAPQVSSQTNSAPTTYGQGDYSAPAPTQQPPVAATPTQAPPSRDVFDEDIPF